MSFCTAHHPAYGAELHTIAKPDLAVTPHRAAEPRITDKRKAPVRLQIFTDWASI